PEIDPDVYGFVFIDGFYPEIAMPILQQARAKGIEVVFDGGSWKPHLPDILPFVDYAICSDNFHPPGCDTYQKIFDYILDQGVKEVAITRGEDNILTPEGEVGIDKVIAVDSLGAGDILHGAFCWYMLKNNSFLQAITNASKVATFSTIYKGTRRWMDKMNFKYKEN
ncbi:MAG: hypothetical protein JW798_16460, partial [Prolixibacteraceae bacterium]|nr:hypothetical protein [Prolixibacteraceae bacterium]